MKLLNREPTEEMLEAANTYFCSTTLSSWSEIYQAMFDAAPEVKVGMTPIGVVMSEQEMGIGWDRKSGPVVWIGKPPVGNIYSAEQVAALQHKANQAILDAANAAWNDRKEMQAENERITAERDELMKYGMELILEAEEYEFDDGMGKGALMQSWNDFEAVASRIKSKITKHEGEKHE